MTLSTLTLADLDRLCRGFQAIAFEEFCWVLRETAGADESYSRDRWPWFVDSPLGYCTSSQPASQGEALLALAIRKAEEK